MLSIIWYLLTRQFSEISTVSLSYHLAWIHTIGDITVSVRWIGGLWSPRNPPLPEQRQIHPLRLSLDDNTLLHVVNAKPELSPSFEAIVKPCEGVIPSVTRGQWIVWFISHKRRHLCAHAVLCTAVLTEEGEKQAPRLRFPDPKSNWICHNCSNDGRA